MSILIWIGCWVESEIWNMLKYQKMQFGFMDVNLLDSGHQHVSVTLMWPSSGWWEQEYNLI